MGEEEEHRSKNQALIWLKLTPALNNWRIGAVSNVVGVDLERRRGRLEQDTDSISGDSLPSPEHVRIGAGRDEEGEMRRGIRRGRGVGRPWHWEGR